MNYLLFLGLLCVASINSISGSNCCYSGTGCRTNCPNTTPTADLIGELVAGCSNLFSITDYGFGVYPVISLVYNWIPGVQAYLEFIKVYHFICKLKTQYYYISVLGDGCPQLYPMANVTTKFLPSTYISFYQALKIIARFESDFLGGCTVFTPLIGDESQGVSCTNNGADTPFAVYKFNYSPAASFAMPIATNNATNSAVRNTINENGLDLVITVNGSNLDDFIQLVQYPETQCGEPGQCKRLNRITDINQMIKDANYSIDCINPKNKNSPCLLSQAVAQAFTLSNQVPVPFLFTSILMAITVPPGCSGITYLRVAGQIYTDSLRTFCLKFFTFCH